jgi:hypothetical protein
MKTLVFHFLNPLLLTSSETHSDRHMCRLNIAGWTDMPNFAVQPKSGRLKDTVTDGVDQCQDIRGRCMARVDNETGVSVADLSVAD